MADLTRLAVREPSLPTPVFVLMSPPDATRSFLTTNADPGAPPPIGIADVDKVLYEALGVPRGGWSEMFGLRSWRAGARAALRGHRIGRKVGDGWTLPVWLVVDGESVTWRWDGRYAGDRPRFDEIPRRSPA